MYEVWMTDSAENAYKRMDSKTQERINNVLSQLGEGVFQHNNIIALHGKYKGSLRYRLGQWRIIFKVNHQKQTVTITTIMPRGDEYK